MSILIYAPKAQLVLSELEAIDLLLPDEKVHFFEALEGLLATLFRTPRDCTAVILFAADRKSLSDMVSAADLLCEARIILILSDRDVGTICIAHKLRPRFLTFTDADFAEIPAVLRKMLIKS